jgi:hypothetical protein
MKTADADRQAGGAERPGEIERARELVRLDADQPDQRPSAGPTNRPDDAVGADALVGLVKGVEANFDLGPEHLSPARIFGERIETGERVRRNRGPKLADRIAIVVVMGWLDQHEVKQRRAAAPHRDQHYFPRSPMQ